MTKNLRFLALAIAVIVNSVALATVHMAMTQIAEHEQVAKSIPDRIVVTAHRNGDYKLATRACPAPKLL